METTMRHWQAISFACLFLKLATQAAPALPGEVVIKPENPAVQVGQPVSVTCTTTCPAGKPAWRKGIDASRFLVRSTAQESTMEIGIAELEDEGDYTCLSRCGEATKRKKTRVHVFAFPEPVVRTVPENPISGRLFDVFCSWRGVYPPEKASLRLFHGGKAFGSEPEESEQEDSRLSNYELKVTNQTGAGSTEYRCEADLTVNGQVLLKNTTLPIQFKDLPQITSVSPDSIAAELGRSASFSCRAQPEPSLLISWEKEGTEGWQLPQRWRQTRSPGRLQVDIQQLRVEDSGNYSCVLRNEAGQVRRGLSIDVLYGPRNAESSPSSLSVRVGEPVTLSCSWDAHPPAIITWTKDSAVPPPSWTARTQQGRSTLSTPAARREDSGTYLCSMENTLGTLSRPISLSVQDAPERTSAVPQTTAHDDQAEHSTVVSLNSSTTIKDSVTSNDVYYPDLSTAPEPSEPKGTTTSFPWNNIDIALSQSTQKVISEVEATYSAFVKPDVQKDPRSSTVPTLVTQEDSNVTVSVSSAVVSVAGLSSLAFLVHWIRTRVRRNLQRGTELSQ